MPWKQVHQNTKNQNQNKRKQNWIKQKWQYQVKGLTFPFCGQQLETPVLRVQHWHRLPPCLCLTCWEGPLNNSELFSCPCFQCSPAKSSCPFYDFAEQLQDLSYGLDEVSECLHGLQWDLGHLSPSTEAEFHLVISWATFNHLNQLLMIVVVSHL